MLIAQLNRSDAEKVFICVRNIAGATISAGAACDWDVVTATDGNAITTSKSGAIAPLFAGIMDASTVDSAYGLLQVYGFRTSAYVSCASGTAPGVWLQAAGGILVDTTTSAAGVSGSHHVVLMETAAVAASATPGIYTNVFIRAM